MKQYNHKFCHPSSVNIFINYSLSRFAQPIPSPLVHDMSALRTTKRNSQLEFSNNETSASDITFSIVVVLGSGSKPVWVQRASGAEWHQVAVLCQSYLLQRIIESKNLAQLVGDRITAIGVELRRFVECQPEIVSKYSVLTVPASKGATFLEGKITPVRVEPKGSAFSVK